MATHVLVLISCFAVGVAAFLATMVTGVAAHAAPQSGAQVSASVSVADASGGGTDQGGQPTSAPTNGWGQTPAPTPTNGWGQTPAPTPTSTCHTSSPKPPARHPVPAPSPRVPSVTVQPVVDVVPSPASLTFAGTSTQSTSAPQAVTLTNVDTGGHLTG